MFMSTEIEIEISSLRGVWEIAGHEAHRYIEDRMPLDPVEIDFNSSVLGKPRGISGPIRPQSRRVRVRSQRTEYFEYSLFSIHCTSMLVSALTHTGYAR